MPFVANKKVPQTVGKLARGLKQIKPMFHLTNTKV